MYVIGADPGVTGACAIIGGGQVRIIDMPTVDRGGEGMIRNKIDGTALYDMLRELIPAGEPVLFALEDVGTLGGEKASAIQGSLQYSKAVIETVAGIARYTIVLVGVQKWKRFYRLGKDKKAAIRLAKELYPGAPITLVKHDGRADALLIAHYVRRTMT